MPQFMLCLYCGETYPFTLEFFNKRGDKGLRTKCKSCKNAEKRARKRGLELPQKIAERIKPFTRTCKVCGIEYPLNEEYFPKANVGFIKTCRICNRAYFRDWQRNNKPKRALYARNYRAKYPEKSKSDTRRRRAKRRDVINAQKRLAYANWTPEQRERFRQYVKQWKKDNPHIARQYWQNRRALEKNADGTFTANEIYQQYQSQNGVCYYCQCDISDYYEVDHYVPLSKGGSNWITNIVLSCESCNASKNDKLPHEWNPNLPTAKP